MPILYAPILEQAGFISSGSEPASYVYALKSSAYDYAELTTEVTLPDDGIISFYMHPFESSSPQYMFRSSTGSYIYYRASDGRFRIITDDGGIFTFPSLVLPLGVFTKITLRLTIDGIDLYIGDLYYGTRNGLHTTFSVSQIGEDITVMGVTIGNLVSYPLLTETPSSTNPFDMIGSNDLTFVNLKDPLDEDDYIKVVDND